MNYLFSHKFKLPGWILFGIGMVLGLLQMLVYESPAFLDVKVLTLIQIPVGGEGGYFCIVDDNIFNEICGVLIIVGGILAAFSKEKYEDEFIAKVRLDSLLWATYFNYGILLLSLVLIYGIPFFWIMVFNMFTTLFLFLIKFNLALSKLKKSA